MGKRVEKAFAMVWVYFTLLYIKNCLEKPIEMEFIMLMPSLKMLPSLGPLLSIKCQTVARTACCSDFRRHSCMTAVFSIQELRNMGGIIIGC